MLALPPAPDAIELRHLRAFVAVAEELNFGRAATRLFLSQPALSRQIRSLERLVGCNLLRRSTHRVELTLAGDALLDRARRLLGDLDDAVFATRSVGGDLERRLAAAWEPLDDLTAASPDLQALRDACEQLHGQFEMAPGVSVRPVIAGGVPSLLLSPRPELAPTVLLLHGGGYVMGSAFGYRHLASALAAAADACVIVPDYRLAPEHPFPAAIEDAVRAYLWMLDSGVPAEQIVLAGDSAGGGLALSVQTTLKRQGLPLPGGTVLLCPAVDLSYDEDIELPAEPQPAVSVAQLRSFAAAYLGDTAPHDEVVNALRADLTGQPPMLIQAGTGDVLGKDAHRLAEHAAGFGVDVKFELYPVTTHDFHLFWSFLPEAADALEKAGAFVRRVRARGPTPLHDPERAEGSALGGDEVGDGLREGRLEVVQHHVVGRHGDDGHLLVERPHARLPRGHRLGGNDLAGGRDVLLGHAVHDLDGGRAPHEQRPRRHARPVDGQRDAGVLPQRGDLGRAHDGGDAERYAGPPEPHGDDARVAVEADVGQAGGDVGEQQLLGDRLGEGLGNGRGVHRGSPSVFGSDTVEAERGPAFRHPRCVSPVTPMRAS